MKSQLKILVTSMGATEHVNACAGATQKLLSRGHRVIFLLQEPFRGKLSPLGFEECIYQTKEDITTSPDDEENGTSSFQRKIPGEKWIEAIQQFKLIGPGPVIDKLDNFRKFYSSRLYQDDVVNFNEAIELAVERYRPDLIYYDGNMLVPAVYYSGIPWIRNLTMTPIFYEFEENIPPGGSGFPTEGDQREWPRFNAARQTLARSKSLNDLFESLGYDRYEDDLKYPDEGQLLTVYAYPEELNYSTIRKKSWFNLEVFHKPPKHDFVELENLVPKEFLDNSLNGRFSGKLIYISLGSIVDLRVMKRLIEVLGKTNHKYIVSKGLKHEQYDLSPNMWGGAYLPQVKILPHVDLVITHGGNQTVRESFIEGKPMIVLPLFVDQFDNAQRLKETGLGVRLDAYHFTDEELIHAISRLMYNEELQRRLKFAAKRILSTNAHEELASLIEELVKANR